MEIIFLVIIIYYPHAFKWNISIESQADIRHLYISHPELLRALSPCSSLQIFGSTYKALGFVF